MTLTAAESNPAGFLRPFAKIVRTGALLLALAGLATACSGEAPAASRKKPDEKKAGAKATAAAPKSASKDGARKATIAVAANFAETANALAEEYRQAHSGAQIEIIPGSSGKLLAQINEGAPVDAFLSADATRPATLESSGKAVAGTRFEYARGILVLWSPEPGRIDDQGYVLTGGASATPLRKIALANPETAPYGAAAREALEKMGLWARYESSIAYGDSLTQAQQFAESGAADAAIISMAQVMARPTTKRGSWWRIPAHLYAPIRQEAVLLKENPVAQGYLEVLRGQEWRDRIRRFGYEVPDAPPPTPAQSPAAAPATAASTSTP